METQSQDTARMTRIEAARQAALGTLSRARETLQVAATTVPAWARGVETKAGETVDALLERVGLVRIARVEAQRPGATAAATSEPTPVEAAAPVDAAAPVEAPTDAAEETAEVTAEAVTEAAAGETTDAPAGEAAQGPAATVEPAGDRSGRRRRR
ncbi:MAG: hypothetical protein Q8S73_08640 [Deltaproteobacteria bacterium]|nr:hypothetical protein [Myxococcales bacterium]MDP3214158.1 hypothetical protein [Deltaproteobacteria bacterium]